MKMKELHEMTMKTGSMNSHLKSFFDNVIKEKHQYKHIGDIENIAVLHKNNIYALSLEDALVGFFEVIPTNNDALLNVMYVDAPFRKQGMLTKFLWFLKRNEGFNKITLGDIHSPDTVTAIKHLAKRFNVYWDNGKEQLPYKEETKNKFYSSMSPTEWRVVLENNGDFSTWNKFYDENDIHTWYEWLID